MNGIDSRAYGVLGALATLPLLELELLDYLRGTEFLTFLSQGVIIPILTAIVNMFLQIFTNGLFGVT